MNDSSRFSTAMDARNKSLLFQLLLVLLSVLLVSCDDEQNAIDPVILIEADQSTGGQFVDEDTTIAGLAAGEVAAGINAGEPMIAGEQLNAGEQMSAGEPMNAGEQMSAGEPMNAGEQMSAGEPMNAGEQVSAGEPIGEIRPLPNFDYFDLVVDLAVPQRQVWAELIYVDKQETSIRFSKYDYNQTGTQTDFWPASTIKMYTATASLEVLESLGFSIDAVAHFSRQINGAWQEELSMSFREMIRRTFSCSSNETYTLLFRFLGVDWLNQEYFNPAHGFHNTALMRDYVLNDARPYAYNLNENQKITIREGNQEWIREHSWSGRSYANERGCTIYNEIGTGNCTSPQDMAEHMRRVIFHERLPQDEKLAISDEKIRWYRGENDDNILNNTGGVDRCGGPAYDGVLKVFPSAIFHHKEGLVSEYHGSIQHIYDPISGQEYVLGLMMDYQGEQYVKKLSEEVARMIQNPEFYVHLDYLQDYVNPISASLATIVTESGFLELMVKPYSENASDLTNWTPLEGTRVSVNAGVSNHQVQSLCLQESAQWHIRGRFTSESGQETWSDLHYVIVDHLQDCENE